MNLICDAWIPVRKKNGAKIKIAPWQITEGIGTTDEIIELAAPRPDFNGALIQFLIGLLQTTCAPQNIDEWRKWLNNPPTADELKKKFEPVAYAFNLDGEGPRFMQDLTLEKDGPSEQDISTLLIDAPGANTITLNKDHFNKRGFVSFICENCVASVLYTLQINAPSGGPGHRVGLRGGGPLTTVVLADSLWHIIWLNIIEDIEFLSLANIKSKRDSDKFPWLAPTKTSEKNESITSQEVHPAHLFWSMPKRIRLSQSTHGEASCDICGDLAKGYKTFYIKNYGFNYIGVWHYPLTPIYYNKKGEVLPVHQKEKIGYKHWLGFVQGKTKDGHEPALIVNKTLNRCNSDFRIWAFGYDMHNMKARCWYEGVVPVLIIEKQYRGTYEYYIKNMIDIADEIANSLSWYIRAALYNVKIKSNKKKNFDFVKTIFWEETEVKFYELLGVLRDFIRTHSGDIPEQILNDWLKHIGEKAEKIFDDVTQVGEFNAVDPGRIATAWNNLKNRINSDEIKNKIGLVVIKEIVSNQKKKRCKK